MRRRALPALLLAGICVAAGAGCFARKYRDNPRLATVAGDPIVQIAPAETLPSVDRATMVPLSRHTRRPDEDDRVLGVALASGARAYPVGLLDRFEVVNDEAGEAAFVVVRCALTGVVAAWDRRVAGRTLLFESTGALWRDTLVFRDRGTRTYWSAATGRALLGPLAGERLRGIPGAVTRGDRWDEVHPDSLYLDLGAETSSPVLMKIYGASPMQGVSGEKTSDRRHRPKEAMFTVEAGDEALAFTAREMESRQRADAILAGEPVRIEWDAALATPRVFGADGLERPAVPMYWFAVGRHFAAVHVLPAS